MTQQIKTKDLIEYGRELGKAEAYKYAFDKLVEIAKEQNKSVTTTEKYFDEPISLDKDLLEDN